ncbi:MAG: carbon-nitrogen hydrolase family protein [Acidobacteria bacterium]|nr:carbon-nitrogen hydrolase family protein [Acidobacteriota bacterium]
MKIGILGVLAWLVIPAWAADPPVSVTVAGIRVTPDRWDKQANLARIDKYARQAAAEGAGLVITPEGFLEGYVANVKASPGTTRDKYFTIGETIRDSGDGARLSPNLERIRNLARELKIYLLAGFAERAGEQMHNALAVFSPQGEIVLRYHKAHNDDDEPFNTTGTDFPVVQTPLGRWGALICYDRQLPETARILAVKGAQLILVPAWGSSNDMNDAMMRTRAFENSVWVAFVHPSRTLIIDPRGNIVAKDDPAKGDQIVKARITFDGRIGRGAIRSRKPELYGDILRKQ